MTRNYLCSRIVLMFSILLMPFFGYGQDFSPQTALSDSFSNYSYSGSNPFELFFASRWQKGSLSNCGTNPLVNVNYSIPNGRLEISPSVNVGGINVNGLVSKSRMNFTDSFAQAEILSVNSGGLTELAVGADCDNWYRISKADSTLRFESASGGAWTLIASISYDSSAQRYWRIRHDSAHGKIVFETGSIETNSAVNPANPPDLMLKEKRLRWTPRAETTINFPLSAVRFEMSGGTESPVASPGLDVFDNFLFDSNSPEVIAPQQTVDTNYPTLDGTLINVSSCGQLQTAIDQAQPGDTITLPPTLICTGNFTFPVKSNPNNKWIVVRSASSEFDAGGSIRAGRRVNGDNPLHRQRMPKLFTNNRSAVIDLPAGANYYRLVGVEIGIDPNYFTPAGQDIFNLINLSVSANQVNHVIIDRCYVHGEIDGQKQVRRGIALNGNNLAVIDSSVTKIFDRNSQTQAIAAWSGSGVFKIENNRLESIAQNLLLGGDSSATPNQSLTDIEIRKNYFYKSDELYQAFGCNIADPCQLPPTNGIEIKQGRRIRISENIFNQTFGGVYAKSTFESGCVFCITEHVEVKNNKFINVKTWFALHGGEPGGVSGYPQYANHITLRNNLSYFTDTSNSYLRGYIGSQGASGRDDIPDFRIIHNTYEAGGTTFGTGNGPNLYNFEMRDNITERVNYGIGGDEGVNQLNLSMFPYVFRKNILVNNSEFSNPNDPQTESDVQMRKHYPCTAPDAFCTEIGTYIASSWNAAEATGDQVGFEQAMPAARRSTGNYRLNANSQFKNGGTDGTDIGVNQNALDAATAGAISGNWDSETPFPGTNPTNVPLTLEVENFDNGGQNVAFNDVYGGTSSGAYRSSPIETVDVRASANASNGYVVTEAAAGEWLDYTVNVPLTRKFDLGVRYAALTGGGRFHIEIDGADVTGQMNVIATNGGETFRNLTKRGVTIGAGMHTIRLALDANSPNGCGCVVADFDAIRFTSSLFDFDGDGLSDPSVFRSADSNWYLNAGSGGFTAFRFGASSDIITPADYDGDGRTDIAVFRPANGTWYFNNSSDNSFAAVRFGQTGDVPVPADYDGDGKADLAVFRPANGTWYYLKSSNGSFVETSFGSNDDKPAVGDYDGDGKADLAVFRPANGYWYIQKSSDQIILYISFGVSSDRITPADYDGDGKTDLAVFRPATGIWYLQRSSKGFTAAAFGQTGDVPVPADYDGDGKADLGIFRPANGLWALMKSTEGISIQIFGQSNDQPIPSFYVR